MPRYLTALRGNTARFFLFVILFCGALVQVHSAPAEESPVLLPEFVSRVCRHYKVTALVEGDFYIGGSKARAEFSQKCRALSILPPSPQQALRPVAEAYDYTIEQQGNVLLLRKRCSAPADLPAVSLAEAEAITQDFDKLRKVIGGGLAETLFTQDREFKRAFGSLTPQQRADLKAGVLIKSLTPFQQEQVQRLIYSLSFEDEAWRATTKAQERVASALQPESIFFASRYGVIAFGGSPTSASGSTIRFSTLETPGVLFGSTPLRPVPTPTEAEAALKAQEEKFAAQEASAVLPLSEQVSRLHAGLVKEKAPEVQVEAAIAERPVASFGTEYTPARVLLTAYARLCALRVSTLGSDSKTLVLKRPMCVASRDLNQVLIGVRNALSPAIIAALHLPERDYILRTSTSYTARLKLAQEQNDTAVFKQVQDEANQWLKVHKSGARKWRGSVGVCYTNAVQQLVDTVNLAPGQKPLVSSATHPQRSALAVAILCPLLESMDSLLCDTVPEHLKRPDDLMICGEQVIESDGSPSYNVKIGTWNAETKQFNMRFAESCLGKL